MSIQGTLEWKQERLGKITASRFKDVMSEPLLKSYKEAGKLSKTAESYLLELAGERLTGEPIEIPTTKAMQWGIDHEPEAREVYATVHDCEVQEVGFIALSGTEIGCSPDGLVDPNGSLEIKCRSTKEHLRTVISNTVPPQYKWQVHGVMLVTGREYCDYVSFDPRINEFENALHVIRVNRDEHEIDYLREKLEAFENKLKKTMDILFERAL